MSDGTDTMTLMRLQNITHKRTFIYSYNNVGCPIIGIQEAFKTDIISESMLIR